LPNALIQPVKILHQIQNLPLKQECFENKKGQYKEVNTDRTVKPGKDAERKER